MQEADNITKESIVDIELVKCTSCGFFLPRDKYHSDISKGENGKDVWCEFCKRGSKLQARLLGTAAHLPIVGNIRIISDYNPGDDVS